MTTGRVGIAGSIEPSADLTTRAGLPLTLHEGDLSLAPGAHVEEDRVRRLAELAEVSAEPVKRDGQRVEYRMLNGVRADEDEHLAHQALRYELTCMFGSAIGWEAAKTAGHVHVRPHGAKLGYPEIVEVLHGEAGFLVQDLSLGSDGPHASHAWLVRARAGDWVVLPPELAHVTIDLGAGPLVFSDVIDRGAAGIYSDVAEARGFAWYIGTDGALRANDRYARVPPLEECDARDWSGPSRGPLYALFRSDPNAFAWLSEPDRFPNVAAGVWARVAGAIGHDH